MKESSLNSWLLTREHIVSQFSKIFVSSLILNSKLEIVSVNASVAEFLRCRPSELVGRSINCLAGDGNLEEEINHLLSNGFFSDQCCELRDFESGIIKVKLSGFHLGLISDFNDLIVLSIQNVEVEYKLVKRLRSWEATMDHLIYRASHDLRGPIASILGLANIGKLRKDDRETDKIFDYIKECGDTLDKRLQELVGRVSIKLTDKK